MLLSLGLGFGIAAALAAILGYMARINHLLKGVPSGIKKLSEPRWTEDQLRKTYHELGERPIDWTQKLPPKLDRRYIVTGGNGLVGGYIVLHLLARGTPAHSIRILDIRPPQRTDFASGPVTEVEYVQTDLRSVHAVNAAFGKPWDPSVSDLPLTVFHTAAAILASERTKYLYDFPHAVNVRGTEHVLAAAKAVGADIFSATTSGSISVLPVRPWVAPWTKEPKHFCQVLDTQDFDRPLRAYEDFAGNYPYSKAVAERLVCSANGESFRTGCIRPAHGVYGNPTDNSIGGPLSVEVLPTWVSHIVQNFVHGANVAVAHLHQEAVLVSKSKVKDIPQAGRPFVVTDPNPPITYTDTYAAVSTLNIYPFRVQILPPVVLLVMAHLVEWYNLLPYRIPLMGKWLPQITGDARQLQPGLFSICTHLIASNAEIGKAVADGGLGYEGLVTTLLGVVSEILEWNRENEASSNANGVKPAVLKRKAYTRSSSLPEQLRRMTDAL